jgi:hypothetical protein
MIALASHLQSSRMTDVKAGARTDTDMLWGRFVSSLVYNFGDQLDT